MNKAQISIFRSHKRGTSLVCQWNMNRAGQRDNKHRTRRKDKRHRVCYITASNAIKSEYNQKWVLCDEDAIVGYTFLDHEIAQALSDLEKEYTDYIESFKKNRRGKKHEARSECLNLVM
mgnify:CR=1 FL=1